MKVIQGAVTKLYWVAEGDCNQLDPEKSSFEIRPPVKWPLAAACDTFAVAGACMTENDFQGFYSKQYNEKIWQNQEGNDGYLYYCDGVSCKLPCGTKGWILDTDTDDSNGVRGFLECSNTDTKCHNYPPSGAYWTACSCVVACWL